MYVSSSVRKVELIDDDTLEIRYFDDSIVDLDAVKTDQELYNKHFTSRKYKKLIIFGKRAKASSEARKYIAENNYKNKDFIIAESMVVHTFLQYFATLVYIQINSANYPKKVFLSEIKARKWLNEQ